MRSQGVTFEQHAVGATYRTLGRTVSETDIVTFVNLCGFTEPLFMDMEYVAKESVFGRRAALSALEFVEQGSARPAPASLAENAQKKLRELFQRTGGGETVAGLRKEMLHAMEQHAGIYRSGEGLAAACAKLAQLRRRYDNIELHDKTNVYNTDLLQALELGSMLDCAQAVAQSALARQESRGAHQRLDFAARDDERFLKHSLARYRGKDAPRIDYREVAITRSYRCPFAWRSTRKA